MTYQIPTAKALISKESLSYDRAAPGYPAYSTFGMGAGRGRTAFRPSQIRKFSLMHPLDRTQNDNAIMSSFIFKGKPNFTNEDNVVSENIHDGNDIFAKHFLFDNMCVNLERTRTVIPSLRRDNNDNKPDEPQSLRLSSELPSIRSGRPYILSYREAPKEKVRVKHQTRSVLYGSQERTCTPTSYEVNTSPSILFPSSLVLNAMNTLSVEGCKLSRPKVHYPTYNPVTVKDNQKNQSYLDPVVGAPRSFIHRISKLSSLEGETVRQEKIKKIKKSRKSPS